MSKPMESVYRQAAAILRKPWDELWAFDVRALALVIVVGVICGLIFEWVKG